MQSSGAWRFDLGTMVDAMWDGLKGLAEDALGTSMLLSLVVLFIFLFAASVVKTFMDVHKDEAEL